MTIAVVNFKKEEEANMLTYPVLKDAQGPFSVWAGLEFSLLDTSLSPWLCSMGSISIVMELNLFKSRVRVSPLVFECPGTFCGALRGVTGPPGCPHFSPR